MRRSTPAILLASIVASLSVVAAAEAQTSTCFRGRPLPTCQSFWITEFSYLRGWREMPTYEGSTRVRGGRSDDDAYLAGEIGHMVNLGPDDAVGATLHMGLKVDQGDSRIAVKARYRRWLPAPSRGTSLEVSPGIILRNEPLKADRRMPGFTVHAALDFESWFALVAAVDAVPLRSNGELPPGHDAQTQWTEYTWYAGVRAGSGFGFIAAGAVGLLILIAAASIDSI
jgi:hypothetical protein